MKCPRCGAEPVDAQTCGRCGAKIDLPDELDVEYKVFKKAELLEIGRKNKPSEPGDTGTGGPEVTRGTGSQRQAPAVPPKRRKTLLITGLFVIVVLLLMAGLFFVERYFTVRF